ncbi:MAG: hypothetical protein FD123_1971 [Bacteroidetes bacterium]|nr:MAG: hypothetical protein FD123_1971 [Bacteroidota bacterium]
MKEISFLKQNHEKWQRFEELLNTHRGNDPDALADLFIQITDDLSYAKTFYPGTNTEKYLNALAARVHQEIYRNKKERRSRLITFWKEEVPELMRSNGRNLFVSMAVFVIAVVIGVFSSRMDPDFVRTILGDGYVNMTIHNIEKGDPMAVYKDHDQFSMFMQIGLNNVKVALIMLIAGFFSQLGPVFILFSNGIMVGAFQYFFYKEGVMQESALTIWMHGTIEMLSFVIEGAAGLALANCIYFPGTYSRGESLKKHGRTAVKIAFAAIPLIMTAAFIESFLTRYTEMNDGLRLGLIILMASFMVWYYAVYPFYSRRRRGSHTGVKLVLASLLILLPALSVTMSVITRKVPDPVSLVFFSILITAGFILSWWTWKTRHTVEEEQAVIERRQTDKEATYAKNQSY